MMSRQSMIALGGAIILGLFAVYIANVYITGSKKQADLGGTTKVAVASVPMAYGTELTPDKVRFVDYPNASIPPGSFTNAGQLMPVNQKRFALLPMGINEPILATKISAPGAGAFIQPNDSVDVLITRSIQGAQTATQVTDVLLQNARVIAIDQEAKNSDGTQKLALGQQSGSLSLVLRKPGEQNNPVVETVSMNDLRFNMYGGARYPAPASVGGFGAAVANSIERSAALVASTNAQGTGGPRRSGGAKKTKRAAEKPSVEIYRGTTSNQYKVGG